MTRNWDEDKSETFWCVASGDEKDIIKFGSFRFFFYLCGI